MHLTELNVAEVGKLKQINFYKRNREVIKETVYNQRIISDGVTREFDKIIKLHNPRAPGTVPDHGEEGNVPKSCYETSSTIIPEHETDGTGKKATGQSHI